MPCDKLEYKLTDRFSNTNVVTNNIIVLQSNQRGDKYEHNDYFSNG